MHQFLSVMFVLLVAVCPFAAHAQSIGQALDNESLVWGSSGASSAPWFGQTGVTQDSIDAARSGAITHGQQSDLTTTVTGPGTLTFWWKVSSENSPGTSRYDILYFWYGDSQGMSMIYGEVNWQQKTVQIPAGTHTLNWSYAKDISGSAGMDAGFVDQVVWTPEEPTPPPPPGNVVAIPVWTKTRHMGTGSDVVRTTAFDNDDNPIFAGDYQAPGVASNSNGHIMVLSLDGEETVWETTIDSGLVESTERLFALKVAPDGSIYIGGAYNGTWPSPRYVYAQLVRKYKPDRSIAWDRLHYSDAWNESRALALDEAGNVYSAGREFGSWGPTQFQWTLLKYSPGGNLATGFPIYYNYCTVYNFPDVATAVVVDDDGCMYVGGYLGISSNGTYNWHIRKYDANRVFKWSDTIDGMGASHDYLMGLASDGQGHVYACGRTLKDGHYVWLLVKYACTPPPGSGTQAYRVWEKTFGADAPNKEGIANALAIADDGTIFVAGSFTDLNDIPQAAMLRIRPEDGALLARQVSDGPTSSQIYAIAIRDKSIAWGGIVHNGVDWDYLYGLALIPWDPTDVVYLY